MTTSAAAVDINSTNASSIDAAIALARSAAALRAAGAAAGAVRVDRIEGLQKAAAAAAGNGGGGEARLRQQRDRYKARSDGLAHELELERSKGHNALPPDLARQRRRLLKELHPDNAPKYAHCTPAQILETLSKRLGA